MNDGFPEKVSTSNYRGLGVKKWYFLFFIQNGSNNFLLMHNCSQKMSYVHHCNFTPRNLPLLEQFILMYKSRFMSAPLHPSLFMLLESWQSLALYELLLPPYSTPYSNPTQPSRSTHKVLHSLMLFSEYNSMLSPWTQLLTLRSQQTERKIIDLRKSRHVLILKS